MDCESSAMSKWARLPDDLLEPMVDKLDPFSEYVQSVGWRLQITELIYSEAQEQAHMAT